MEKDNVNIVTALGNVLENLVEGKKYDTLPPRGPIDLPFPTVSNEELSSTDQDIYGQDEGETFFDGEITAKKTRLVESPERKEVKFPDENSLDGLNVIGISGDNKRILTTSFHLMLARSTVINFKYTKGYDKPYFYTRYRDASALMVLDNNIFEDTYSIYTYNDLSKNDDGKFPILDHINKKIDKPFRFKYDHEKSKQAPSAQSLGLAVKFQHALELASIEDTDFNLNGLMICIKNGALFSNSTTLTDIRNGLSKLLSWTDSKRIFLAISSEVADSRVLIQTLKDWPQLRETYFPDQHITETIIKSFGTDTLLLKKILKPGTRTPLIEYIEPTREAAIEKPLYEGLRPLTCYYHKRSRPFNFVRLEVPKFFWENNKELVEFAISVAFWQHELGGDKPLVLKAAADRSELTHEKWVIEQQMKAIFDKKKLDLIEFLNFT